MMMIGTPYFLSRNAAIRYYADYHIDVEGVEAKLRAGEIHIGRPKLNPGERLTFIDGGTRYAIITKE